MEKKERLFSLDFLFGAVGAFVCCAFISSMINKYRHKSYPITVDVWYVAGDRWHAESIQADSVVANVIYKDGKKIVNNNIVNVTFN